VNEARTISDPLEPGIAAKLASLVRQHGAFILGFEQGRNLVHRADEFALDAARFAELEAHGNPLLKELATNRNLVEERTLKIHQTIYDAVFTGGWQVSRTGYAAYLIIRNSFRAMVRYTVGQDLNVGSVASLLAAGSVLAGDPTAEFVRAAIPALQEHGAQLLAFFNHSPEMRAYIEWALALLSHDAGAPD
jgi:hypothetical protein